MSYNTSRVIWRVIHKVNVWKSGSVVKVFAVNHYTIASSPAETVNDLFIYFLLSRGLFI